MVLATRMIAHVLLGILLLFEGLSKREYCHRKRVYVEDITQHSAVLHWKTARVSGIKDYKVMCAGVRQYITVGGHGEVDLETVSQFVPPGIGRVFLNHLQPNFNYSCTVKTGGQSERDTRPLLFSTLYSAPEEPAAPVIVSGDDGKQIDIHLFPTSTRYGPIDGYEVQFHILDDHTSHVHGRPDLPWELTQPKGLLASVEAARSSTHPIPFCMVFKNESLPSSIRVSDSFLQGALRSGPTYLVITVAYTNDYEEISNPSLYALSQPSKSFSLAVTTDTLPVAESALLPLSWLESQLLKLSMAVGVVCSNMILIYFLVVGCCLLCMTTSRKEELSHTQDDLYHHGTKSSDRRRIEYSPHTTTDTLTVEGQRSGGSLSTAGSAGKQLCPDAVDYSVGISDTRPSLPGTHSLPVSSALTSSVPDMCSPEQPAAFGLEAGTEPVTSAGNSAEEVASVSDTVGTHLLSQENVYMISPFSSTSPSFGDPPSEVKCESPLDDKMCMRVSSVLETDTKPVTMASLHQLPALSGHSLSSMDHTERVSGGLYTTNTTASKSVEVSASTHSHNSALLSTSDLTPIAAMGGTAPQQLGACESSLVFLPRGLSHGPQLHPTISLERSSVTSEVATADLAPDMEMDLYGISYSMDDTLDH